MHKDEIYQMHGRAEIESTRLHVFCITSDWNDWTKSDLPRSLTFSDLGKSDPVQAFLSDVTQSARFNLSTHMRLVNILFIHVI